MMQLSKLPGHDPVLHNLGRKATEVLAGCRMARLRDPASMRAQQALGSQQGRAEPSSLLRRGCAR
jgi:hypothetical protein